MSKQSPQQALTDQEMRHRRWMIVRLFYESYDAFLQQASTYDARVLEKAQAAGVPREKLRLGADELAGLLEFKSLENLRNGPFMELKEICHQVFRTPDATDPLDRYVSDIFHEISILKEEHYTVKTYATAYDPSSQALRYILDEAHEIFPKKFEQVRFLFAVAKERLEHLLREFRSDAIVIRSLYLERDGFVAKAYPDGLERFYALMYELRSLEGYARVGDSFYHSGFVERALAAYRLARDAGFDLLYGRSAPTPPFLGTSPEPLDPGLHAAARARLEAVTARLERIDPQEAPAGRERVNVTVS